jgi:putative effector of murein hydrolase LrgA (UPF0299 family)
MGAIMLAMLDPALALIISQFDNLEDAIMWLLDPLGLFLVPNQTHKSSLIV